MLDLLTQSNLIIMEQFFHPFFIGVITSSLLLEDAGFKFADWNVLRASIGTMHPNLTTMWTGPATLDGGVRSSSTKIATAGLGGGGVVNQDNTVGTLSPAISVTIFEFEKKLKSINLNN
uniref:Uncharacterized protein n=1 Tax=Romanomermis culicivorax TaxID=13658 RepID=A0A915KL30_ROMCU